MYSKTADPDYEGHFLLELQIAPLSSAVRTAVSDASPAVVPAGCLAATTLLTASLADDATVKRIVDMLATGNFLVSAFHLELLYLIPACRGE